MRYRPASSLGKRIGSPPTSVKESSGKMSPAFSRLALPADKVRALLGELEARDLLGLDSESGQVRLAYPFTQAKTEHRVELHGRTLHAPLCCRRARRRVDVRRGHIYPVAVPSLRSDTSDSDCRIGTRASERRSFGWPRLVRLCLRSLCRHVVLPFDCFLLLRCSPGAMAISPSRPSSRCATGDG